MRSLPCADFRKRPTHGDDLTHLMNQKEQIEALLQRLDFTLHYVEIFDRWVLDLKDADGNTVWHRRGLDLVELRNELMEFLMNKQLRQ